MVAPRLHAAAFRRAGGDRHGGLLQDPALLSSVLSKPKYVRQVPPSLIEQAIEQASTLIARDGSNPPTDRKQAQQTTAMLKLAAAAAAAALLAVPYATRLPSVPTREISIRRSAAAPRDGAQVSPHHAQRRRRERASPRPARTGIPTTTPRRNRSPTRSAAASPAPRTAPRSRPRSRAPGPRTTASRKPPASSRARSRAPSPSRRSKTARS